MWYNNNTGQGVKRNLQEPRSIHPSSTCGSTHSMLPCTDSFLTISQAFQPACMRGTTPEGTLSLSLSFGGRTQISVEQRLSLWQFLQLNVQWNSQVPAHYDVECMRQAFQVPAHHVGLYMVAYIPQHNGQGQDHFP